MAGGVSAAAGSAAWPLTCTAAPGGCGASAPQMLLCGTARGTAPPASVLEAAEHDRHWPTETQQWGRWCHLYPFPWLGIHFLILLLCTEDRKISCPLIPKVMPDEQKSSTQQNAWPNPPGWEGTRQGVGRYSSWRDLLPLRVRVNLVQRSQPWADPSLCFHVLVQGKSASSQRAKRQP